MRDSLDEHKGYEEFNSIPLQIDRPGYFRSMDESHSLKSIVTHLLLQYNKSHPNTRCLLRHASPLTHSS